MLIQVLLALGAILVSGTVVIGGLLWLAERDFFVPQFVPAWSRLKNTKGGFLLVAGSVAILAVLGRLADPTAFNPGPESELAWWELAGMGWPLAACLLVGLTVIVVKFTSLTKQMKASRRLLRDVDALIAQNRVREALEVTRGYDSPAATVLHAGLKELDEGAQQVKSAVEDQEAVARSKLERGLFILASVVNIAPLVGFVGTAMVMVLVFQSIEAAGEVEATLVAGGIKVALLYTAGGLIIAVSVNVFYNYFVTRIDQLSRDIHESSQRLVQALDATAQGSTRPG